MPSSPAEKADAPLLVTAKSPDEKKLEKARQNIAKLNDVVGAARVLAHGWHVTGFYDRQEFVQALALHEALTAYDTGEKS